MTNIFDDVKKDSVVGLSSTVASEQPLEDTAEEFARQRKKMYDEVTREISTTPLNSALKAALVGAVEALYGLKQEIVEKKEGAIEKRQLIRNKVTALCDSGKVHIDASEFEKSDESVKEFVALLDRMIQEVDTDYIYYKELVSDQPPATIVVFIAEQNSYEQVIADRIEMIKRYVKTAKRDLAVSYSRYCYGFESQLRQILYVEQVLTRNH